MIYFFILFLSVSVHSMELEDLNEFPIPRNVSSIERFKKSRLKQYIKYYKNEKKEGRQYFNGILKEKYLENEEAIRHPTNEMLVFWFADEIFSLEKYRRTKKRLKIYPLINLLRNKYLIPKKIRDSISFPPIPSPSKEFLPKISLLDSSLKALERINKFLEEDIEVKEYI